LSAPRKPLPPYDPPFESAWLKWAQAIVHAQTLDADVEAWGQLNRNPVRAFRAEYQAKRHGFAIIIEELDPIPARWRLLLGDIANNYRAALDHLAWALVSRGKTPPETGALSSAQEKAVYFPISQDRPGFNAEVRVPASPKSRFKLLGIRLADSAVVRRAQPYHRGARRRQLHPLVLLAGINTGDKHRAIQPIWTYPSRFDIEVTHMRDCVLRGTQVWGRKRRPLGAGAELALLPARRLGDNPELEMKLDVTPAPTIGESVSVREWHAKTGILLFKLLCEFSAQPASIHEVGAVFVQTNYG
jgi:hypothetical protein